MALKIMKNSKTYRPNKPKKSPEVDIPNCRKRFKKDGSIWYLLDDFGNKCMLVLKVLAETIEPKYSEIVGLKARDVNNWNTFARYYEHLAAITKYLLERKGEFANPFENIVEDYLDSVYRRYTFNRKMPFMTQLGPYAGTNADRFEEYIHHWEQKYETSYWRETWLSQSEIDELVKRVAIHKSGKYDVECDMVDIIETE